MGSGVDDTGAARTRGRLEALAPGQAIPYGGDACAYVSPELAAAFRPGDRLVVVQDTGFTAMLPTGRGLLAFTSADEAAEAIARVERDYAAHAAAARHVAQEHFAAERVLERFLADAFGS